jgi:hypothetical protein
MAISPPLNVGWGYGIVLGLGALFAFGMVNPPLSKLTNLTYLMATLGPRHVDPQAVQQ